MKPQYLERKDCPRLAYFYTPASEAGVALPAVMFLGGYRSDMAGTKAMFLEERCRARGQAYVRFDYSGHGISEGRFEEGTIGAWLADALAVFDAVPTKPVILVGSSMGGWIALLLSLARAEEISGLVGIAAAPDFTRALFESFTEKERKDLIEKGYVEQPSLYSDEPYIFTKALIEDGDNRRLLDKELRFPMPVRLIQGMKDADVPWQTAYRIKNTIVEGDVEVLPVENGDHRLSAPENLELIDGQVRALSGL